jgi:hypothetical protein
MRKFTSFADVAKFIVSGAEPRVMERIPEWFQFLGYGFLSLLISLIQAFHNTNNTNTYFYWYLYCVNGGI